MNSNYVIVLESRDPGGTLDNFTLHKDFDYDSFLVMAKLVVVAVVFFYIFSRLVGDRFSKTPKYHNEPLEVKKIIVDETNLRKGIRVPIEKKIIFDSAHFRGPQRQLPSEADAVDISLKGLAFLSPMEFPLNTDINFKILESSVTASPIFMGTVVASRPHIPEEGQKSKEELFLTSLSLKNIGDQAYKTLLGIVTEAERVQLTKEREKKVENSED